MKKKNNQEFVLPAYQWVIILLAFIMLWIMSGCEICEECTTTTYQVGGIQDPSISTREVCGRQEIKNAEKTVETNYSGVIMRAETKCR